jgi:hypothetical protein
MAKIHGGALGEVAQEFFYTDASGKMYDADLHENMIFAAENQIDEQIMAPIRAKYAKKYADVPLKKKPPTKKPKAK